MRKIIVTEFISADGIAEVEKLTHFAWNSEMDKFKNDELSDSGAMLLGRTTYQIFAGSWPKETGDFAERFNALPKYVASTTLKELDWKPAELLRGALPEAVRKLKQGSGGNIYVHGSISVAQELLRHGLVDRIRLLGYPVALGQGKPFFAPGEEQTRVDLGHALHQWHPGRGICTGKHEVMANVELRGEIVNYAYSNSSLSSDDSNVGGGAVKTLPAEEQWTDENVEEDRRTPPALRQRISSRVTSRSTPKEIVDSAEFGAPA